jgi:hypothetical protein
MIPISAHEDSAFVFHSLRNTDDYDWPWSKMMLTGALLTGLLYCSLMRPGCVWTKLMIVLEGGTGQDRERFMHQNVLLTQHARYGQSSLINNDANATVTHSRVTNRI